MADPLDRYASVYSPGEEPEVKCSVRTIKEFSPVGLTTRAYAK
jgi:hypothetical protein